MSTAKFFMGNFGRYFVQPSGSDWDDVGRVLRSSYPMTGKASMSRMQSGWAIVRPDVSTMQLDLVVPGVAKSRMTRFEAFAAELALWDGREPRIFMLFDKAPISAQDVFVSVDKRCVRVCTNSGARTENWLSKPPIAKGVKP